MYICREYNTNNNMTLSTKQVTLPSLIAGITFLLGVGFGGYVDLRITDANILGVLEKQKVEIENLKQDKVESNKKLDTIILMLTDVRIQMANKQDRK